MGEDAAAVKVMAAQLAAMLRVQQEKGWNEWIKIHRKLAEVAAAAGSGSTTTTACQGLLKVAQDASSSQGLMRSLKESVAKANPAQLKYFVLVVAHQLNMTPLCDSETVHMVDEYGNFCQGSVDRIMRSSAELSAPKAPYSVISIVGPQKSGKSFLLHCLFGTKFPVMDAKRGWTKTTRGIMMSRCAGPSLLLLDLEGFEGRGGEDRSFEKHAILFVLTVSDIVIVNMSVFDIGREEVCNMLLFRTIFQERAKLPKGHVTKILVVLRRCNEDVPGEILGCDVLRRLEKIWESVNQNSMKFKDYVEVSITGLPDEHPVPFRKQVTILRKLLSNNRSSKVPASSFSASSRISWHTTSLKDLAAQLAVMLRVQRDKGRDEWINLHRKLVDVVVAAVENPKRAGQSLLKVAKEALSSQTLMRTLEGRVSQANPALLKDIVLLVANELNMTPLCDSEPVHMVDDDSDFCKENVDRIIKCSAELSDPNASYAVVSIIGGRSSGKSSLLNHLFGTKFPEMGPGHGRSRTTRGIMMSRCIGPSLLLLDFEGFRTRRKGEDTTFQKQATLFALTVSDLVIVNMPVFDIGRDEGFSTLLFRILFQERTKLPQGFTKIIVVVHYSDGQPPFESLRSNVKKFLEKIWESVVEYVKFKDCIEVNTVRLPDKNSSEFPKAVTLLRKQVSNIRIAEVPSSGFSLRSSILWDTIQQNKKLDIHQFFPGKSIFASKTSINSGISTATEPSAMTFQELERMTDCFSKERLIGTGGYGTVYKGVLDSGETIAVKKLKNMPGLVEEQFKNEVLSLWGVQHKNIIKLVGYCSETRDSVVEYEGELRVATVEERALCLEYMQGGTLDELLSDESGGLDWDTRLKIIKGMCKGLQYLHTGLKDPICHMDLKPQNILLDKDMIPKIGDFGLSKLLHTTNTCVAETRIGTIGYMPPEYIDGLEFSPKFDVFSLGVIIMEVIAGRNAYNNYKSEFMHSRLFTDNVTRNWHKRDQGKPRSMKALLGVRKCIKIALRCVEDDRANRPTITEIVEELNVIYLHQAAFCADARDETALAALSV